MSASSFTILADAYKSLSPITSRDYYVSIFDPSGHDIDLWYLDVDRDMSANG